MLVCPFSGLILAARLMSSNQAGMVGSFGQVTMRTLHVSFVR